MTLAETFGLGERELIALGGGGGKSTVLFTLGRELAGEGKRVILTTTTKMGRNQADSIPTVCWSADIECAAASLEVTSPVMLVTEGDDHKVTGPSPELVDDVFAGSGTDYVIVEADGSRGRPLKASAGHEPVIPSTTTIVVALVGVDAVGKPLAESAHRVEEATRFTDMRPEDLITPEACAEILLHPQGVLRDAPTSARCVIAITKADNEPARTAAEAMRAEIVARRPDVPAVIL